MLRKSLTYLLCEAGLLVLNRECIKLCKLKLAEHFMLFVYSLHVVFILCHDSTAAWFNEA